VVKVGQEYTEKGEPVYTFADYSPMQKFGLDSCVSGQLVYWEVLYEDILAKVYVGVYPSDNLEVTVLFDPFSGPIKDQEGRVRIEAGRRASHDELWTMAWFVENVVGKLHRH